MRQSARFFYQLTTDYDGGWPTSSTPVHSTNNGGSILQWFPFEEEEETEKPEHMGETMVETPGREGCIITTFLARFASMMRSPTAGT